MSAAYRSSPHARLPSVEQARSRLRRGPLERTGIAAIGGSIAVLILFALLGQMIHRHESLRPPPPTTVSNVQVTQPKPPQENKPLPLAAQALPSKPPPGPPSATAPSLPAVHAPSVSAPDLDVASVGVPVDIGGGSLFGSGSFGGFGGGPGNGPGGGGGGNGFGTASNFQGHLLIPLATARPQMPEWACKQGISGWVTAAFIVGKNGNVHDVRIINADPRGVFEQAVIESISHWVYPPQDHPIEVKQKVEMKPSDCRYNWPQG